MTETKQDSPKQKFTSPQHIAALNKYYKGIDHGNNIARRRSQAVTSRALNTSKTHTDESSVSSNTRSQSQQLKDTQNLTDNNDDDISTYHVSALAATNEKRKYNNDSYIIDTGCIGSHVLKNTNLVSQISESTVIGVKDFSGTRHAPSYSGKLLNTRQKVLVMNNAKVNLISTEQIFKEKKATCAIINEHNFVFLNDKLQPILNAMNPGDGSYVCTSKDLVKAFGDTNRVTDARFLAFDEPNTDPQVYTIQEASDSVPPNSLTRNSTRYY
jgi:hypothetical protein